MAIVFPALALVLAAVSALPAQTGPKVSLPLILALVAAPVFAERISIQLGPRSWYTAATPAIVLAGLLGGPLVGVAAGACGQILCSDSVWRRRFAEGGLAALQGWSAGMVGGLAWTTAGGVAAMTCVAFAAAVAVNTGGRITIMLSRGARPFAEIFRRGLTVDVVEALVMAPLTAILVFTAPTSEALVGVALVSGLATITVAHRLRLTTIEALWAEQANARRDQLTGAPNRRAFEEALAAEHARIVRGGLPAGLFVVDVDHFKGVNDRYGHAIGDETLVAVVQRLTDGLRQSDVIARWGGEEMTVLAPALGSRHAVERFARRVCTLVGEAPIVTSGSAIPVTVSVGGTLLDGSIAPMVALQHADQALYDAKQTRDAAAVRLPQQPSLRVESA